MLLCGVVPKVLPRLRWFLIACRDEIEVTNASSEGLAGMMKAIVDAAPSIHAEVAAVRLSLKTGLPVTRDS